jgi:hypothetical protein
LRELNTKARSSRKADRASALYLVTIFRNQKEANHYYQEANYQYLLIYPSAAHQHLKPTPQFQARSTPATHRRQAAQQSTSART